MQAQVAMKAWFMPALLAACTTSNGGVTKEQLGKLVFNDKALSQPAGQSCADCHAPTQAFRDPESDHTSSMGVIPGRFGVRNAPTAMYAAQIPPLQLDVARQRWIGGLFWDGRAATLEEQAAGPLLNPLEMANPDKAAVVDHVRSASYAPSFRKLFGPRALDDVDAAFDHITEVIAVYERSPELSPFSSKYDRFVAGTASLTTQELHGLTLFNASCASCHPPPQFTDFSYANLGIPKYLNSMFYRMPPDLNPAGEDYIDRGLGAIVHDPAQDGRFRVPTLRNVMRTNPYSHNGYFANADYLIDFINTRDIGSTQVPTCSRDGHPDTRCAWPPPEVAANLETAMGNLGLSDADIADLVAFLRTLNDE